MGAVLLIKNVESIDGDAKLFAIAAPCDLGDILALFPYAFLGLPPLLLLLLLLVVLFIIADELMFLSDDVTAGAGIDAPTLANPTSGDRPRLLL